MKVMEMGSSLPEICIGIKVGRFKGKRILIQKNRSKSSG